MCNGSELNSFLSGKVNFYSKSLLFRVNVGCVQNAVKKKAAQNLRSAKEKKALSVKKPQLQFKDNYSTHIERYTQIA